MELKAVVIAYETVSNANRMPTESLITLEP